MIDRKDENFGRRMIPEPDLNYLQELKKEHEDPTAPWGGGGGLTVIDVRPEGQGYDAVTEEQWNAIKAHPENFMLKRSQYYYVLGQVNYSGDQISNIRYVTVFPNQNGSRATLTLRGYGQGNCDWVRDYLDFISGVYRYKIIAGFNWQTMQGTAYYTVYFNLDTTTNYGSTTLTFDQMRSLINNQGWVTIDKTVTTTGELNFYQAYVDTDQGEDTIVFESDNLSTQVSFSNLTWFDYLEIQRVTL